MCIAVPMQVVEPDGAFALCRDLCQDNEPTRVDLRLVGPRPAGAYVLVFLGAAREVVDKTRALQTRDALLALQAAQQGAAFEHLFADLVDREPELPEFLRGAEADPPPRPE